MAKAQAAAAAGVNWLVPEFYAGGGGLPEGDYALEFNVQMHQSVDQNGNPRGPNRLGVMLTAHSLEDTNAEARTYFLSMGRNADKSFAPSEDGKSIVPVPGGPASTLPSSTNWAVFFKSLLDCDPGVAEVVSTDISPLDGIHVHIANIPEPEERKSFQGGSMSEVEGQQGPRRPGVIPVVSEIKEDGKPWEGGGGVPEAEAPKAKAKPGAKPAAKAAPAKAAPAKPAAKAKPAPAPAAGTDDEDVKTAALTGIGEFLEKNPSGGMKVLLRTTTHKKVTADFGAEMAQTVADTYFADDDALNALLAEVEFTIDKGKVIPVS